MDQKFNKEYQSTKETIDKIEFKKRENPAKCAIFVMVQNEPVFLPIWLKYYSRYFEEDAIFVLDHRSSDGSIEKCAEEYKFNHIKLDYPYSFDHLWIQFTSNNIQKKLLNHFEYVLFTDVDEIIFPNPDKFEDLRSYLHNLQADYVRCKGYELIHMKKREKPFDESKTVLSQRSYWYANQFFSKTPLAKKELNWEVGNHHVAAQKTSPSKDLFLIHLHKLDFDMCFQKSVERSKLRWKTVEIEKNRGWQNRITDLKTFKRFFYVLPRWFYLPRWLTIRRIPTTIKEKDLF